MIFKVEVEWPWRYRSRSKVITCDTPSHASDHLYQIWKESIQNCRRYRADTILKVRASKTFVLFVLCTEAETGYFGGRQAVKGQESQYSLTEAFCLFSVPPPGLHLSPVTNIHIIDRVLYCRMSFLSPIIENWLWKWYRRIEKSTFQANFVSFSDIFYSFCGFVSQHVWNAWNYLCGNHDCPKSKKEADFVLKKVRRPKMIFWRSAQGQGRMTLKISVKVKGHYMRHTLWC